MIKNKLRKLRADDSGFTLIELLIVIVVLGILAGIVVFGVGTFRSDSTAAATCANYHSVDVASAAFIAKSPTGVPAASVQALVDAKLLKTLPSPAVTYNATTGDVAFPTGC